MKQHQNIKAIMGLGNPGPKYAFTPHNIGFLIVDNLAEKFDGSWIEKQNMMQATIMIDQQKIVLIKPMTFMNDSGAVLAGLRKQGIDLANILVVHDDIDFDFGKIKFKDGGSARGHNGLRSLIAHAGDQFLRLRCGVGRPDDPKHVHDFVVSTFQESKQAVEEFIQQASNIIKELIDRSNLQDNVIK